MQLNDLTFAGYAGKDAEVFNTSTGTQIVTISICHTEKAKLGSTFPDQNTWLKVKVFGGWTELASKIKKGDNVIIKGRLQENKWTDKETGKERTSLEATAFQIGVLPREEKPSHIGGQDFKRSQKVQTYNEAIQRDFGSDEIPF